MFENFKVISNLKDKDMEIRIIRKVNSASRKTGLSCRRLVLLEYKTLKNVSRQGGKNIVIHGVNIPVDIYRLESFDTITPLFSIDRDLYFIHGIEGSLYIEPPEIKIAHELLHQEYEAIETHIHKALEKYCKEWKKNSKRIKFLHMLMDCIIIESNIEGRTAFLYGKKYYEEIQSLSRFWIKVVSRYLRRIGVDNWSRHNVLLAACTFYSRSTSLRSEIYTLMETTSLNLKELTTYLLFARFYEEMFDKGKNNQKTTLEDVLKLSLKIKNHFAEMHF